MIRFVLAAQGVYYVVTGAWPLVSIGTFEAVTGPKTDDWLVQMVGALAVAIGLALLKAFQSKSCGPPTILLARASALAFATIDLIYVQNGTIRSIYLGDAVIEMLFIGVLSFLVARQEMNRDRAS